MGIKNLFKFLNDRINTNLPGFCYKHISDFTCKKIAVDVMSFLYKFKSLKNDEWHSLFMHFICTFRKYNIHPVFIYDGESLPDKIDEQKNRRDKKNHRKDYITTLLNDLNKYKSTMTVTPNLETFANRIGGVRRISTSLDTDLIELKLSKMATSLSSVNKTDIADSQYILELFNIPFYTSKYEAEILCVYLCNKRCVDAVLTEDSDVLAHLGKHSLFKLNKDTVLYVDLNTILKDLDLTEDEFIDFCIMCGTDYNKSIPKIGPVGAYNLIKKYGSIDNIPLETEDLESLNHKKCRKIFKTYPKKVGCNIKKVAYCGTPNYSEIQQFLEDNNIRDVNIYYIKRCCDSDIELD